MRSAEQMRFWLAQAYRQTLLRLRPSAHADQRHHIGLRIDRLLARPGRNMWGPDLDPWHARTSARE
jgi:hypothetical protein